MINKEVFNKRIPVLALRVVAPVVDVLRRKLDRASLLGIPRIKTVVTDQDPSKRLVLLSESIKRDTLPEATQKIINEYNAEIVEHEIMIGYEHYTTNEVLSKLLPEGLDVPSSFETVGHLAHINLRDEHAPYKNLIGQVILDKNQNIRTVVNKTGAIESTFRFFEMEVLAGEKDFIVNLNEEGCYFRFDYSKVYWNSRLQFEHCRLIEKFKKGEFVCDLFCGVGPFVIPAAKKGCIIYANDLNPESIKWLKVNIEKNKINSKSCNVYNLDAREFVGKSLEDLQKDNPDGHFHHYIMNLPASAHEFLDAFPDLCSRGLIKEEHFEKSTIHCYVFCKTEEDPIEKVSSGLGYNVDHAQVKRVRDVAPNKEMFCVSFQLPKGILSNKKVRTQ